MQINGVLMPLCVQPGGVLDLEKSLETTQACIFCVTEKNLIRHST